MHLKRNVIILLSAGITGTILLLGLCLLRYGVDAEKNKETKGSYEPLLTEKSIEDPLAYIGENFSVEEGFHTKLPIIILSVEEEFPEYKYFSGGQENVEEGMEPYVTGTIEVIDQESGDNSITDTPRHLDTMKIKKRGHTSFLYDKSQYLIKLLGEGDAECEENYLGMGAGDSWVLNGSMADKSMIRNYLGYRIASEIDGNSMGPDSRFCEVVFRKNGTYQYAGLYLLMEDISRGKSRVNIDKYKSKNTYSSYIVRRDRFTRFDPMLETYGRLNGYAEQWIGLKYPSEEKLTESTKKYIENDFSRTEQIIYAEDESVFRIYDKYIDFDSFVDYFLINEYFGNYDAGEHSTYMYKNSGDLLHIGPVWDFDQAMNNYFQNEMETDVMAFQTQPFYDRLTKDRRFIDHLKDRYSELSTGALSQQHVFSVIDETTAYIEEARQREWYRWAADYEDGSFKNFHNYYLQDYEVNGITISRFNDDYQQEIYNIKNYLYKHSLIIQTELTKLYDSAEYNSSIKNENELFLLVILALFLVPSLLINRKG